MLPDLRLVLAALVTTLLFVGVSFSIFATLRSAQMQSATGAAPQQRHPTVIDRPMATASLPSVQTNAADAREPAPPIAEYPSKVRPAPAHLMELAARDMALDLSAPAGTSSPLQTASGPASAASAPPVVEAPPAFSPPIAALQTRPEAAPLKTQTQSATAEPSASPSASSASPETPATPTTSLTNASAEGSGGAAEVTGSTNAPEVSRGEQTSPAAELRKRVVRHGRTAQKNKRRLAKRVRRPAATQAVLPVNPIAAIFGGFTKGSRE